jgi:anti-sigma factor RsiW
MKRNLSNAHPEDTVLLAYLDAELPRATKRSTEEHLHSCWKCRAALAELELQAQAVSQLLGHQDESDSARAERAKAKFLERKSLFEARTRRSVARFTCLLYSQRNHTTVLRWFERATLETA